MWPGEVAYQHQLESKIVGVRGKAEADPRFHRNGIAGVVHHGPKLMPLLV
jgi:hypothetical protein